MELKKLLSNKKVKNILITLGEIILVAGIIFGALMYIQSKVNREADQAQGLQGGDEQVEETKEADKRSDNYEIEVNIKKRVMTIYQYEQDNKTKKAYKVVKCAVGKSLKPGKYKTGTSYSWLHINGSWHRYNTQIGEQAWIQTAGYRGQYAYTLGKTAYREIGSTSISGSCIVLYAKDAAWVQSKCKAGTVIRVVKGKKSDKLPMKAEQTVAPSKACGWDPTDPDADNPYKKAKNGKIVAGVSTVYVEKGHTPEYLGNLLARSAKGKNLTTDLKYETFDTSTLGTHKVQFTYKQKKGKTLKYTQKFVVVDTTSPVVQCSQMLFEYEVESEDVPDVNNKENIKKIIEMVKKTVSCNESDATIEVTMFSPEELEVGKKAPVVVTATDPSGNIGTCQVMCEIKVKEPETTEPETTKKKKKKKPQTTKPAVTKKVPETTKKTPKPTKKPEKPTKKTPEKETTAPAIEQTTVEPEA